MTDDHFARGFAALCLLFRATPDREITSLYQAALSDLTSQEWSMATERAAREAVYFPKPAELRNYAGRGESARQREARVAWEIVRAAMDKYDYVYSVDFGPTVNALVRNLGGWQALCARSLRDLTWERKRFEETYLLFCDQRIESRRGAPLKGAFGGKPVPFQIPGQPERRVALPEQDSPALTLVRQLAESKGAA